VRAREHWGVFDQLAMMQLGTVPASPPGVDRFNRATCGLPGELGVQVEM
jgi:hypothetical protein